MQPFRVLSIDGGGIRGIIPAVLLSALEQRAGKPVCELFDLIAGTSTGGILALLLTKPAAAGVPAYSAAAALDLYTEHGAQIFDASLWHRIRAVDDVLEQKYPAGPIETLLQQYFGVARLSEALTPVLIPGYEIEIREPWFFRSERAKAHPDKYDFLMWEVARATSAAPTYFPPELIQQDAHNWALIDGGTFANNPGMCAWAEAARCAPDRGVLLASLGTGEHTRPVPYAQAKDWGLLGWARPILDIVFDGVSKTTDYELCQLIPRDRYYRFQLRLPLANNDLDNASAENIAALTAEAQKLATSRSADLDRLCAALTN